MYPWAWRQSFTSHQTWPWTYLFKIKLVTTALLRIIIQETGRALEFCWEFNSKLVCGDNSRGGLEFLNIPQPFHFLPNKITRAEFGKSLQSIDNISAPLFKFSGNSCPEVLFWNRELEVKFSSVAKWKFCFEISIPYKIRAFQSIIVAGEWR